MAKSEQINELAKALAAAQSKMRNPAFDKQNPHFKSKYASLAAVRDAVLPVLAENGLSVVQYAAGTDRGVALTTLLLHASGQWVETEPLTLPAAKADAQGYGSAMTYARRYALQALAGVAGEEDDDGNAAAGRPAGPQQPAEPPVVTGPEFKSNLESKDNDLAKQGRCKNGDLLAAVLGAGKAAGLPADLAAWDARGVKMARTVAAVVMARLAQNKGEK